MDERTRLICARSGGGGWVGHSMEAEGAKLGVHISKARIWKIHLVESMTPNNVLHLGPQWPWVTENKS